MTLPHDDGHVAPTQRARGPITRALEYLSALLLAAMVVLLLVQVVARYALSSPPVWTEEIARGVFIYVTFIGGAVAIGRRAHLKIDVLLTALPQTIQSVVRITSHAIAVVFLLAVLFQSRILLTQLSNQPLSSLPVSKATFFVAVPLGCVLMVVYELLRLRDEVRLFVQRRTTVGEREQLTAIARREA